MKNDDDVDGHDHHVDVKDDDPGLRDHDVNGEDHDDDVCSESKPEVARGSSVYAYRNSGVLSFDGRAASGVLTNNRERVLHRRRSSKSRT